ncbi:MAG: hypothetical protein GY756_17860 [bacterium]|nr:hypothetical protein [bacterium]
MKKFSTMIVVFLISIFLFSEDTKKEDYVKYSDFHIYKEKQIIFNQDVDFLKKESDLNNKEIQLWLSKTEFTLEKKWDAKNDEIDNKLSFLKLFTIISSILALLGFGSIFAFLHNHAKKIANDVYTSKLADLFDRDKKVIMDVLNYEKTIVESKRVRIAIVGTTSDSPVLNLLSKLGFNNVKFYDISKSEKIKKTFYYIFDDNNNELNEEFIENYITDYKDDNQVFFTYHGTKRISIPNDIKNINMSNSLISLYSRVMESLLYQSTLEI